MKWVVPTKVKFEKVIMLLQTVNLIEADKPDGYVKCVLLQKVLKPVNFELNNSL